MTTPSEYRVLVLEGTPRERGRIHGEEFRADILECVRRWRNDIQETQKTDPDACIAQFIQDTDFATAVKKWTPHLLDEVHGIAEGAAIDYPTALTLSCIDEFWWYTGEQTPLSDGSEDQGCSGLGVFGQADMPPMIAQNVDVPNLYDGLQILLRVKQPASDLEAYVYTFAGTLGANGLNNQPLGLCVNTLQQLDHRADGLPVAFVVRGILEQATLEEAIQFARNVKHASGQNYIIGGAERVVDLEASANQVAQFVPCAGVDRVYHTNHPLANDDQGMFQHRLAEMSPELKKQLEAGQTNTRLRYETLESRLKDPSQKITVEAIESALRSHDVPDGAVCVHNERGFTSASTIMVFSEAPELHITLGPPCMNGYARFTF